MAVTSQYPQFMLVSASSDKIATNDGTPNDPYLLQVPNLATGPLDSEQFEKRQRRLSTASSLRTIETSSDAPTFSSTSLSTTLSTTSSATSFKSSTSLSSHHFLDPDQQDESEGGYQLKITPRSTYKDSRLVAGLGKGDNQPTFLIRKACRYNCHCKCHNPEPTSPRRRVSMFKTGKSTRTDPACQRNSFNRRIVFRQFITLSSSTISGHDL